MQGLYSLDRMIAGHRDDGLHPRLRELMEERLRHRAAAPLDAYRANPVAQAGPNPRADASVPLPEGVAKLSQRRPAAGATMRKSIVNE